MARATLLAKELAILGLARSRRWPPIKALRRLASAFVKGTSNYSFNMGLNGERRILEVLSAHPLRTFFDVGANHGEWTRMVLRHFPAAAVHCFELAPPTYLQLRAHLPPRPGLVVNDFGLGDKSGAVEFSFAEGHDGHSSLLEEPTNAGGFSRMHGRIERGDRYVARQGLEVIDFLKIDVEGADFSVLEGFGDLVRDRIRIIQFEYGRGSIVTGRLLKDWYARLEAAGFAVGKVFPDGVEFRPYALADEDFLGPNFLAVHRSCGHLVNALRVRTLDVAG